jgi:hypothetical protein
LRDSIQSDVGAKAIFDVIFGTNSSIRANRARLAQGYNSQSRTKAQALRDVVMRAFGDSQLVVLTSVQR